MTAQCNVSSQGHGPRPMSASHCLTPSHSRADLEESRLIPEKLHSEARALEQNISLYMVTLIFSSVDVRLFN